MKITKMRVKGKIPSTDVLLAIERELKESFTRAGFITNVSFGDTRSSMKIGLHMRSFSIDVSKLGYNATIYANSLAMNLRNGYKRTNVPTWNQRVKFNQIVNKVLTRNKVSATVRSGPFLIRDGLKALKEVDWRFQVPEYLLGYTTDVSVNGLGNVLAVRVTEKAAKKNRSIEAHI